jgi:hypothetical protein
MREGSKTKGWQADKTVPVTTHKKNSKEGDDFVSETETWKNSISFYERGLEL